MIVFNQRTHTRKDNDVYIGRPGPWGNPFVIGKDGTRLEVVQKYERWARSNPVIKKNLHKLMGKNLVCWCAPELCHGHILKQMCEEL